MNNTFNKELNSAFRDSTYQFEQEQYELDHKKDAQKLSLYYAHGRTEKRFLTFKKTKEKTVDAKVLNDKVWTFCKGHKI